MKHTGLLLLALLTSVQLIAQDATVQAPSTDPDQPVFRILSESTVQQKDGSSITFRQVAPPVVAPQAQPTVVTPTADLSQAPVKESKVLGISASVHANGYTVLRWTCGESQRLQAVSNVDFRYLQGLGGLETAQTSYILILSAGPDEQVLTDAEARAAQTLPTDGNTSFALVSGSAPASPADEAALDAMNALLDFFDSHQADLVKLQAQREAERAASELAASTAPPPPPRRSIVHFWPLQPAQRAAILENTQREKEPEQP